MANRFSEAGLAEKNKDTTATENVTAMSAENFANKNPKTVVDEAEDLELYASEFAEEVAEENFANMISEKVVETQNAAPSRVASSHAAASRVAKPEEIKGNSDSPSATEDVIKTDLTLPDESGPLHGDRLRKYQLRYLIQKKEL